MKRWKTQSINFVQLPLKRWMKLDIFAYYSFAFLSAPGLNATCYVQRKVLLPLAFDGILRLVFRNFSTSRLLGQTASTIGDRLARLSAELADRGAVGERDL
jgi:hypothetical protein